ncbi:hypothetical protein KC323_g92 [Hortaea werneckii]|nr:hypothetical protein KC323_g92 [Hortaea werneckii]
MLFHDVEHDADNVLSSHFVSHLASYTVDLRRVAGNSSVFICLIQERVLKSLIKHYHELGRIEFQGNVGFQVAMPLAYQRRRNRRVASWVQSSGERISQVRIHFDGRLEKGIIGQVAIVSIVISSKSKERGSRRQSKSSNLGAWRQSRHVAVEYIRLQSEHEYGFFFGFFENLEYATKKVICLVHADAGIKADICELPYSCISLIAHSYFVTSSSIVFGSQTDCANVIAILHQCHQPIGPSSESVTWSEGSSSISKR